MSISKEVHPPRAQAPLGLITSIIIAALGGFVGGMLLEHGPTYFSVHITQPVLGEDAAPVDELSQPSAEALLRNQPLIPKPESETAILASGAQGRLVVHTNDAAYLVLQDEANEAWGQGKIRSSNHEGHLVSMRQDVKLDEIPAEHRAWLGAPVTLFDSRGYACSGTADTIELLEQYVGEGMELETWDEYGGGPLLAVRVSSAKGRCKEALWARHAELPAPSLGRISGGTKSERRQARKAFRASKSYRELQSRYEREGHQGAWDKFWDGTISVNVVRSAEQELIFASAQVGGCGEFDAQLGLVFVKEDDGTLRALPSNNDFLSAIEAAADIDGDGDLDFVSLGDGWNYSFNANTESGIEVDSRSLVGIYVCRC